MFNYIAAFALLVAPVIAVPWTNATCSDQLWSNSRGQSPCLVAAYLGAQCTTDNTFGVTSLGNGTGPYGITAAASSTCVCTSVAWNLLSACALCQKKLSGSWGQWVASCPSNLVTVGRYPIPLPAGVSVPSWAYHDFTIAGAFDAAVALQQTGPESSAISVPTSTLVDVPSPTVTRSLSPGTETDEGDTPGLSTSRPIKNQFESTASSNTGAIVGGVVGGILGIVLIALIAFVLTRKRKSGDSVTKFSEGQVHPHQFNASNQPVSTPEYKPYNPSDPSTYSTGPTTPVSGHHVESIAYSYQPQGTPGQQLHPGIPQV